MGIFLILSGISIIDKSYGTYSENPVLKKQRLEKQMIYSLIGFALFAIASIVLYLLAAWVIAFALLAAASGRIINGFIQLSQLRDKNI